MNNGRVTTEKPPLLSPTGECLPTQSSRTAGSGNQRRIMKPETCLLTSQMWAIGAIISVDHRTGMLVLATLNPQ